MKYFYCMFIFIFWSNAHLWASETDAKRQLVVDDDNSLEQAINELELQLNITLSQEQIERNQLYKLIYYKGKLEGIKEATELYNDTLDETVALLEETNTHIPKYSKIKGLITYLSKRLQQLKQTADSLLSTAYHSSAQKVKSAYAHIYDWTKQKYQAGKDWAKTKYNRLRRIN